MIGMPDRLILRRIVIQRMFLIFFRAWFRDWVNAAYPGKLFMARSFIMCPLIKNALENRLKRIEEDMIFVWKVRVMLKRIARCDALSTNMKSREASVFNAVRSDFWQSRFLLLCQGLFFAVCYGTVLQSWDFYYGRIRIQNPQRFDFRNVGSIPSETDEDESTDWSRADRRNAWLQSGQVYADSWFYFWLLSFLYSPGVKA